MSQRRDSATIEMGNFPNIWIPSDHSLIIIKAPSRSRSLRNEVLVRSTVIPFFPEGNAGADITRWPLMPILGPKAGGLETIHQILLDEVMNGIILGVVRSPIQW